MRIVFAGTPDIAATVLRALLNSEYEIVGVLTQPDRPAGRGRQLMPSPVKQLAEKNNIPVYQLDSFKSEAARKQLQLLQADLMVVVAYGLLLPQAVLDMPTLGCWNVHVSLLPRWRGAAPIQRAIEAGDTQTGVTIMQMDAGLDTGPVLLQQACVITPEMTAGQLHDHLADMGAQALLDTLVLQRSDELSPQAQSNQGVTYAHKLSKAEAKLDWSQPAVQLVNKIRAFNPWPIASTKINDVTVRVWQATMITSSKQVAPATIVHVDQHGVDVMAGDGAVRLQSLQLPGKKALAARDIINQHNHPFQVGACFDSSN